MCPEITFSPQWTPQSQFAGYYAALDKGFYAEVGLDVSIVHPTASYSSLNMLKDGTSDIITSELIQAMVAKYDNYELGSFSEEVKHAWRDAHWEDDLQRAYDAGRKMAEQ